ncbi:MAG: FAD-dependent oxidoreductase [Rubrobacteraceae bacterium]
MKETPNREALEELEKTFGDRLKSDEHEPGSEDAIATAMPLNVEEVQILSETAQRYSIPLIPLGAGTSPDAMEENGGLLVRFDLMRHTKLPEGDETWIEAEPGTVWLELEDELRARGLGLAVYPTSAPRATVGGWLTTDGLGVGSFEYGWLSENVISANVVLPGGELYEMTGEDLKTLMEPGESKAVAVGAKLRTRTANTDTPFAVAFEGSDPLLRAVKDAVEANLPLWHLSFLNPKMAQARGLGEKFLLFGAYPRERSEKVEEGVHRMAENHGGNVLPAAEAHRIWTERFFPVAPSHTTPNVDRTFVPFSKLDEILSEQQTQEKAALQGTVARSKEMLLLTFEPDA